MSSLILIFSFFTPLSYSICNAEEYVFFINLNNSYDEDAAVEHGAQKSHREILRFPIATPDQLNRIQILSDEKKTLLNSIGFDNCNGNNLVCTSLKQSLNKTIAELASLKNKFLVTEETLVDFLSLNREKKISSIVISGSHATGVFSGINGDISDIDISNAVERSGVQKESIVALHLIGCYTVSPTSLLENWLVRFPSVKLFTGYFSKAPRHDRPVGWQYLIGLIENEAQFASLCDSSTLLKKLKGLKSSKLLNAAIYTCGYYVSPKETYELKASKSSCDYLTRKFNSEVLTYNCYLDAKVSSCLNPPEDSISNPIRIFYETLQKISVCKSENQHTDLGLVTREQTIRLLFFDNIKENLIGNHHAFIAKLDQSLAAYNAPKQLHFYDVNYISRKELLDRLKLFGTYLNDSLRILSQATSMADGRFFSITKQREIYDVLVKVMINLSDECVPFAWVEPNQVFKSQCIIDFEQTL